MVGGAVAQLGERGLCKPEVVGSIPISSTRQRKSFNKGNSGCPVGLAGQVIFEN